MRLKFIATNSLNVEDKFARDVNAASCKFNNRPVKDFNKLVTVESELVNHVVEILADLSKEILSEEVILNKMISLLERYVSVSLKFMLVNESKE